MNEIKLISTNDIWLDYGLEHLYRILQDCEGISKLELNGNSILFDITDKEKLRKSLLNQLLKVRDSLYLTKLDGQQTTQIIHQILLWDWQNYRGLGGIYAKCHKQGNKFVEDNRNTNEICDEYMEAISYNGPINDPCPLCGEQITKSKNITQSTYPFGTKSDNFSKIKGLSGGYFSICPRCYLYGQLAIGDLLLLNNGEQKRGRGEQKRGRKEKYCDIFLPNCKSLEELKEIKEKFRYFIKHGDFRGNIGFSVREEKEKFITPFDNYSALLQIYNHFINYMVDRTKEGFKFETNLLALKWTILSLKKAGKTIIKIYEIDISDEIVDLMWNLQNKEGINLYADIVNKIFDLNNKDDMRAPAKALSKAIITGEFNLFVESIIPKGNRNILVKCGTRTEYGLDKLYILINYWRLNKMDINKEEQELLKEWGEALASVCVNKKTFVYRLDKKRRFEDFIETLKDMIVYTMGKTHKVNNEEKPYYLPYDYKKEDQEVNKDILNLFIIHKNDWKELKNVFVAYLALNTHIKSSYKKKEENKNDDQ
ncbi:hypothetical protein CVT91_08090 [Candidatus Atribacteria bacterium HGW-Atribacteria-1]|nr:MAG: hypothetical protein CVT91_08090 [Candidatus Atribacteria bacterium HGW-Atribacteria-1]